MRGQNTAQPHDRIGDKCYLCCEFWLTELKRHKPLFYTIIQKYDSGYLLIELKPLGHHLMREITELKIYTSGELRGYW